MKFKILDLPASDFLDLETYFKDMVEDAKEEVVIKFFELLIGEAPTSENQIKDVLKEYSNQIKDIKETFTWLYNPPQMPSSIEEKRNINREQMQKEFSEDYSGYIEIIYLLCKGDFTRLDAVGEMRTQDFLFYGEYLVRKRYIESC